MKNLIELSREEKNRILSLHENATKRFYLAEQQVIQGGATDPYQYRKTGDKVEYAKKGTQNWQVQTNPKGVEAINKLFLKSAPTTTPVAPEDETSVGSDNEAVPTTTTTNTTTGGGTGTPTGTPTGTGAGTQTNTGTDAGTGTGTGTGEGNKPSTEVSLRDKITTNCGEIWNSYLERLKKYQEQMKGKDLKSQKTVANEMSKDETKTFKYCHKLYKPKMLPNEKKDYTTLASNFKKLLSTAYKFLAPAVVKMMQTTVEKASSAGTDAVLKSLKISGNDTKPAPITGESRYKESDLDRLIKESIRKNTKNL